MLDEVPGLVGAAGQSLLDVGVVGALLVLSILGNVALVWALVRAYRQMRWIRTSSDPWGGPY